MRGDGPIRSAIGSLRRAATDRLRRHAVAAARVTRVRSAISTICGPAAARARGAAGRLRRCRIGEERRRMRARLQKDRIDDDDEARRRRAENAQRNRPAGAPPCAQSRDAERSAGDCAARGTDSAIVAALTHFSSPECLAAALECATSRPAAQLARWLADALAGSSPRRSERGGFSRRPRALAIERQAHGDARALADPAADRNSPPCSRTRPLTMESPSPVPPWRRS